ncbi:FKBP-type peptidyl-prolyl cis-trans isomerase [Candidatus Micrarchaeota archaeon]|nr:FKBP-type peptidyl-prolyl cis-trans isomerase [Candidatus Micrarchaeota archaeon]
MKVYIGLALLLVVLFGCSQPVNPQNNTTQNNSQNSGPIVVALGDKVSVDYALYVDGKIVDTNNLTVATQTDTVSAFKKYEPLEFFMTFESNLISGFVANIVGMTVNETKNFTVAPTLGYGAYDPQKTATIGRYYQKNMLENVSRKELEAAGINTTKGISFNTASGTVFINDVDENNVTLFYLVKAGDEFNIGGVPQKVISTDNLTATIEYAFYSNRTYTIADPNTGVQRQYRLLNKTNDSVTLDYNHPLAGKTLNFVVTVLSIQKQK